MNTPYGRDLKLIYFKMCVVTNSKFSMLGFLIFLSFINQIKFTIKDVFYIQYLEADEKVLMDEFIKFKRTRLAKELNYKNWGKYYD